jgi:glycosyltransferase involved in cell wall biosynthesis
VRHSLGFGPDDFVLGYVGRFSAEKQTGLIVDAVAQLPLPFKAMFVGWGEERRDLMEAANARIPGRHAFVTAAQYLGDFYHAMDALCLVSVEEGFSMVLLEAMMCKCPVIVTPVGSVPEMIHDHINGIIVTPEPASIALAAQLLQQHPHWARGVAAQGKAYAQQHGHALRMARQYEDCLEKLWLEKNGSAEPHDDG